MGGTSRIYIAPVEVRASALPLRWDEAWGQPNPFHRRELANLREGLAALADGIPLVDESESFGPLVHAGELPGAPVHRWYYYKEAFSPRLPGALVGRLGTGCSGTVADVFAGVGTTPLSLRSDPRVARTIGIEYSPFAQFVGQTKLSASGLEPSRLRASLRDALAFDTFSSVTAPELATFHNESIFAATDLRDLLLARDRIDGLDVRDEERAFLRLGLAAAAEYLSQTIKDGRALRIVGYGHRKRPPLMPRQRPQSTSNRVADALAVQWTAMIEDLESSPMDRGGEAHHLRGDARELGSGGVRDFLAPGSVGLCLSSPPYLNCIDYTEVYKIELWLLGFVSSQEAFRDLRLGTIRSHPSIDFPDRPYLATVESTPVGELIELAASFVERNHARSSTGRMIRNYFGDMVRVLEEQYRVLEPGGHAVLIVGNSTFSRRDPAGEARAEQWRIPILTDVILARIGETVGYVSPEIWTARELRARNVTSGTARESLVVLRKPPETTLRLA